MLAGRHKGAARPDRRRRFEELALPHTDALYGAALRLVHNARDAEDLVQDALLRAYQSFDDFDGDGKCKAWLFRILMNAFVNKYRRRVLEQRVQGAMEETEAHGALMSASSLRAREPEGAISGAADDLQRALGTLPEEFRLAVVLCDIEEFSYREIADIMGCPVGTVMSRLYRGRRLLQAQLRDYAQGKPEVVGGEDESKGAAYRAPEGRGVPPGGGAAVLPLRRSRSKEEG